MVGRAGKDGTGETRLVEQFSVAVVGGGEYCVAVSLYDGLMITLSEEGMRDSVGEEELLVLFSKM